MVANRIQVLSEMVQGAIVTEAFNLPEEEGTVRKRMFLRDLQTDKDVVYTILGSVELDLDNGVMSYGAPIAQQRMGRKAGREEQIRVPLGGNRTKYGLSGHRPASSDRWLGDTSR